MSFLPRHLFARGHFAAGAAWRCADQQRAACARVFCCAPSTRGAGACEGSAQAPGPARLCPGCWPARSLLAVPWPWRLHWKAAAVKLSHLALAPTWLVAVEQCRSFESDWPYRKVFFIQTQMCEEESWCSR